MIDKTREIALKILYEIDTKKGYSNIVLNEYINKNKEKLTNRDIGLISEIIYGVTTWKLTIDEIIKKHSKIKIKKISDWILNILRMGIFQIIFLDKIPKSAAVNESVNLAKRYGHKSSSNYVNAILRKVDKKDYEELFEIKDEIEKISKTLSMPRWIIEELIKDQKDIKKVEKICKELNKKPKTTIRRNNLKIAKEEFEKMLEEKNYKYEKSKINEDFYIIDKVKNIENQEEFQKGYYTIQDISAGLSAKYLEPKKGEKILDACSAPGGKTTYIAELMENEGEIEAWDIYKSRTNLIEENAKRLGITIIKTKINDASKYDEEKKEKFDKILLDVPCLGIGVIKRKPDIKWQRKQEDIEKISKIQIEILKTCSKYLKENGKIIYSTCSILKEENEKNINRFIEQNKEFEIEKIEGKDFINILPNENQDGFFIAKLIKKQKNKKQ